MKDKLNSSFRFEIIIYTLLSLVFTILSEGLLGFGAYFIIKSVNPSFVDNINGSSKGDPSAESYNYTINKARDSMFSESGTSSYDEFRFKEDVNISIRLNRELFFTVLMIATILGIALFILYFLLLTRKFSNYLYNIVDGIEEISEGNYKHRVPVEASNEFGLISYNLNKMAYQLEQINLLNKQNEKNKNAVITSLAHDLRTPLTSITGYLELIDNNSDKMSKETKTHYLEIVYNKSKDLERLINDLFDYTRVSLGEIRVNHSEINMVQFINQIIDEFYPSFSENDLEYGVHIEQSPIYIYGDGELLARAISNLIANAIKYGKDGKMVNVYLKKRDNNVILQIINYGQIIPEEAVPHLFERFYRVDGSRSSETGGTGLGLSIAKEIIELHGGTISATSNLNGTLFELTLPAVANKENKEKGGEGNDQKV